jgi:hypothetical protein
VSWPITRHYRSIGLERLRPRRLDLSIIIIGSRENSVGIMTDYGLDGPPLIPGNGRFFSSPRPPPTVLPIPRVPGALSPGLRRQGGETVRSSPSSAEVKMVELYLHFPVCLHGIVVS